jgi:hypothetical protein
MKARLLFALLASTALARAAAPTVPIYEENFNTPNIEYINGAAFGPPGTGVSGKPADRAYIGTPKSLKNEPNDSAGLSTTPITPKPLTAFTCTFWYYLDEQGPELQVPLNTAAMLFLLHEKGFELRIENQMEQPRAYVFTPGVKGPLAGWRDKNKWIFAVFSWDQETNTLLVHQGTPDKPVAFMRDMKRPAPGKLTLPRTDLDRSPEVIGNTSRNLDRPFAGRMDNLRVYDRVLEPAELEVIRQADIVNAQVKL